VLVRDEGQDAVFGPAVLRQRLGRLDAVGCPAAEPARVALIDAALVTGEELVDVKVARVLDEEGVASGLDALERRLFQLAAPPAATLERARDSREGHDRAVVEQELVELFGEVRVAVSAKDLAQGVERAARDDARPAASVVRRRITDRAPSLGLQRERAIERGPGHDGRELLETGRAGRGHSCGWRGPWSTRRSTGGRAWSRRVSGVAAAERDPRRGKTMILCSVNGRVRLADLG
jgi:hypothetical protein